MRVLILSELFYPHGSGAELATYLYAKLLSESGVDVIVITNRFPNEPNVSKSDGFHICRFPIFEGNGSFSLKYSTSQRIDILFSKSVGKMMKWADIVYIPRRWYTAIPVAKAYKKPVIVHLHDYVNVCPLAISYDSINRAICQKGGAHCLRCISITEIGQGTAGRVVASSLLNFLFWPFVAKLIELSDSVVCVSKAQKELLVLRAPFLRMKTTVIYNPLPPATFTEIIAHNFGYFGGPSYLKGFHVLFEALRHISNIGDRNIVVYATNFEKTASKQTDVTDRYGFRFFGKLDDQEYNKIWGQIRTVIAPSIWLEPWGYTVTEAIIKGRLIVASRVGGIVEQVEGCKGAFLFSPGNYHELADRIEFTKSLSKEQVSDLVAQNKEQFSKNFDDLKTVQAFKRLCYELIRKE